VASCLERLSASAARYGFQVLAYCFMPDHLHALVVGSVNAPLVRFCQHFKQATGYVYPGLWHRSYFDHILRQEEAIEAVALYIWHNPVRAGLVDHPLAYRFAGPRDLLLAMLGGSGQAEDRAEALSLRAAASQSDANLQPRR
jgi:putative transposase